MVYTTVFSGVATMLIYVGIGFGLTKWKKTITDHARTLSGLLIYCCSPCLIINSFLGLDFSLEYLRKFSIFFVVSLIIHAAAFLILYLIFGRKFDDSRYKVLIIGATLGNGGFFGLPIITAVFPDQPVVACYSMMFITAMNILVFTVATYLLTGDKKYVSVKSAIINPTVIPAAIGLALYLLQVSLPDLLGNAISILGQMSTPLCMLILGLRLASMDLKSVFGQAFAYISSFLKLIAFPLFAYLCVYWIPFLDDTFKLSILVLCGCPTAAVVLSVAEFHNCNQKLASNVILLSTLLCIITLPLMCMIFIR